MYFSSLRFFPFSIRSSLSFLGFEVWGGTELLMQYCYFCIGECLCLVVFVINLRMQYYGNIDDLTTMLFK